MTAGNVCFAESSDVVSAAALGSEVQYLGLVMCNMKSYQQLICVVDSFFYYHGALLRQYAQLRFFILSFYNFINNFMEVITMEMKSMIRLRMSAKDAHYGGNLVDGAHMVHLFGDVATELLILQDGDEGLFCAYDNIEFLAPVYAGDYIEAVGEITKVGNTSRKMKFEARKVIVSRPDINDSAADVLEEPIVVCRATGTCVTPKDKQNVPRK